LLDFFQASKPLSLLSLEKNDQMPRDQSQDAFL